MDAEALVVEQAGAKGRRVVTAASRNAAAAGIATYLRGGNAFDAAIAACLYETVVLPMKCGLAGDVVALARQRGGPFRALLSVGPGARALDHGARLEVTGPRSVGIPGVPSGYATLAGLGRLGLPALVEPAVAAAERGVAWARLAVKYTEEAEPLIRRYNGDLPYLPDGRLPVVGEELRLPGLARLLSRFAEVGDELFFEEEGAYFAEHVQSLGGFVGAEDLRVKPARWSATAEAALADSTRLFATPEPTHGAALMEAVRLVREEGREPVDAVRTVRRLAKLRGRNPADGGTSVVTASDDEGNSVVVVHSNSFPRYGSGVVLPRSGLILSNRPGRGFDLAAPPGSPAAPAAGRMPPTTLHAWGLEREGEWLIGATPGGVNQLPWNTQSLLDCLAGHPLPAVVTRPHWALPQDDELLVEAGNACEAVPGAVPRVIQVPRFAHGSVQQIQRIDKATGRIEAAADPRTGAIALALD